MSTMSDKTVVDIFKSMEIEPVKNSSALLGAKVIEMYIICF